MAAGLPVVATEVGGAREAIVEGETGFLVPSGDNLAMAERIIQLLKSDKLRAMGERGRAIVETKFSAENHLRNTLELYDELLSAGKRVPTKSEGANRSAGALAQP